MVDEATKTNRVRGPEFSRYFTGRVLDIGCGPDPVVPHAEPFDIEHGDANHILNYFAPRSFDCVHSSHCLEHMTNVPRALAGWWELVKPGGFLILVVPDEDLYEQGYWPSIFNPDHKATFRVDKECSWSPVSYDVQKILAALPCCEILDIQRQTQGYDLSLLRHSSAWGRRLTRISRRRRDILKRIGLPNLRGQGVLDRFEQYLGKPVDQTFGNALAQIQAVIRRRTL